MRICSTIEKIRPIFLKEILKLSKEFKDIQDSDRTKKRIDIIEEMKKEKKKKQITLIKKVI